MTIGAFAVLALLSALTIGLIRWFRQPARPGSDPWSSELEQVIHDPATPEICHRCLTPQTEELWFCSTCGAAIGPYNNCMPYLNAFSEGEVFRAGVNDHIRPSFLTIAGYLLLSTSYSIFAPIYWYLFIRNLIRHRSIPVQDAETPQG